MPGIHHLVKVIKLFVSYIHKVVEVLANGSNINSHSSDFGPKGIQCQIMVVKRNARATETNVGASERGRL